MKQKNFSAIIEDSMSETKALYMFMAIIELIFGAFLIIFPDISAQVLTIILGAILTGVGVFNIISYFMNKNSSFRQGILSGVISTALGIAFIAQSESITNVTSIILGVFVIFEALTCCKRAIIMCRLEFDKWFVPLIIAVLAAVLGMLLLIFPSFFGEAIMIIVGIALVIEAILGIWSIIFIIRLRNKFEDMMNGDKSIVTK